MLSKASGNGNAESTYKMTVEVKRRKLNTGIIYGLKIDMST